MAELVPLGLKIESEDAETGAKRLDDFAASAGRAERATDALATGSGRADGAIARMVASIETGVRDLVAMGQAQLIVQQHAQQAATATQSLAAANDHLGREAGGAGAAVRQLDSHVDAFRASAAAAAAEAKALAQAEKAAAAEAANMAARAASLKASVDPLGASIDKVSAELREADALFAAGAINQAQYGAATTALRGKLSGLTQVHVAGVTSSKAMTQATLNLSRQFADVGVTAAMGMNPLMIMIQQGPQIADAFQMASTQGLGFSSVLKGMAVQLGLVKTVTTAAMTAQIAQAAANVAQAETAVLAAAAQSAVAVTAAETAAANTAATAAASALAAANVAVAETATAAAAAETLALGPILVILAPIVAAIAAVTAGFALFHRELSKDYPKNITDGLNLTEEQLKRVKTTTVSFGDTFAATFTVLGRKIMEGPIGDALRWLGDAFGNVLDFIGKAFVTLAAGAPAALLAAFDTIVAHWKNLPAIFGDIAITAINFLIRAFNALPAKIAEVLNMVLGFFLGAWESIVAGAQALPGAIAAAFSRAFKGAIDIARNAIGAISNAIKTLSTAALDVFTGAADKAPDIGAAMADGVRAGLTRQPLIQAGPLIAELENPFAGAGQEVADTFADSFSRRFEANKAALASLAGEIGDEALARARKQALEEAGEANKAAAAAGDQRAASLQRELDALEATTAANYELAKAYEVSGAKAAEAEARAEAIGKAIRRQGDIELFVAAQMALNASKEAVSGAKRLRDIDDQLAALRRLNALVAAGTLTADQANQQLEDEANLRPLIAAAATQEGERKTYLLGLIDRLTKGQADLNRETMRGQILADNSRARDQIALIEKETELLGASNVARAVTLAQLAKEQELRAKGVGVDSAEWADAIKAAGDLAKAQEDGRAAAENHNAALYAQLTALQQIEDRARDAGQGMADAFGPLGKVLGDLTSMVAGYATAQEDAARRTADAIKAAGDDQVAIDRINRQSAEETARARIDHYGDLLSASKGFFDKESGAYKTLQAAEQVYRAFQFAMSVKALLMKGAETAATVTGAAVEVTAVAGAEAAKTVATTAGAAVRIPMKIAEGAAAMFAALGPLGFVAVGAMVAVLAALGFSGRGSSVSVPVMPTTNTGTGTVLGNPNDPSESLTKSLEMSERYWNKDLDYSNKMVASLRAIQANIGNLTTAIAKEMNVGGGLNPTSLNQGPTTSGGIFGIGATTRSASVVGSGINLNGGALAQLIANGVSGALYQIVQNTKTKSGFLGFGGGTTTWNTETTTGIDASLSREISRVLASLRDGVLTAAGQLGVEGAGAVLDAFQVNLGRISFDGLSSQEINDRLNAVFSAVGDDMAKAVLPGLQAFQQAGEGLFETLARLVTEYKAVDDVMAMLGKTFGPVGLGSIEARNRLVELSGGLEAFAESADFFAENFLTEAQRIAPIQAAVAAELERLGLASDISRSQFADLVMGLDVSTEAGAAMYAALMALAPALAKVLDYTEETTGVIGNATDLARQRRELELRLLEAQGRISEALAERRADELAAMDATLRPLQEAVWAAQDMSAAAAELAKSEQEAAAVLAQVARQRRSMEIELLEAQGRASEALAARRNDELDALDASLRPLQLAIWAARDLADAQAALAEAQKEAEAEAEREAARLAAIAQTRANLEIELLEATGRSAEALAARRALEIAALDESLRPLLAAVHAAQDLAAASAALATEQAEAARIAQEAADRAAQIARQRADLEIQLMDAQGNAAGALAARRAMELEALDASLRPLQEAVWAALDLADANRELAAAQAEAEQAAREAAEAAARIAAQRRDLEIQLMEAQGDAVGALAARRELELAALDATLRPLQESVWAALDLAAANEASARAQADAAAAAEEVARQAQALANQRRGLELELMEVTGRGAEALAARRQDELDAMDESLRALQIAIWANRDMTAAQEAAAAAARDAAAAAEELARAAAALAAQRRGLEIALMEATGDAMGALAARRADELAALDPTLRALQAQVWAAQDLAAASQAAAAAQAQQADAARALAAQRRSLEIELMRATGDTAGALAATRADELAAMDESLRSIQLAIYAAQDLAAANAAAAEAAQAAAAAAAAAEASYRQRVEEARGVLAEAYQKEAGDLQTVIDKFGSFGESLRAFRDSLGQADDATASYASRRADFLRTANRARLGDETAMGDLQGVSQAFLDASLQNASSNVAYQRDVAAVRAGLDAAIGTADRAKSNAERQLEALQGSVSGLIEVNKSVLSVRDAIRDLMIVMAGGTPIGVPSPSAPSGTYAPDLSPVALTTTIADQIGHADPVDLAAEIRSLKDEVRALRAEQTAGHTAIAANTGRTARTLDGWDVDGLPEERDAA